MLAVSQLLGLERALRGRRVLSVFVDTSVADPGARSGWRHELDRAFVRLQADASRFTPGERTALELCLAHVRTALEGTRGTPGRPGWVAYATTDDVVLAGPVRAPVMTRVFWQQGMVIAPLLAQSAVPVVLGDKTAPRREPVAGPAGTARFPATIPHGAPHQAAP